MACVMALKASTTSVPPIFASCRAASMTLTICDSSNPWTIARDAAVMASETFRISPDALCKLATSRSDDMPAARERLSKADSWTLASRPSLPISRTHCADACESRAVMKPIAVPMPVRNVLATFSLNFCAPRAPWARLRSHSDVSARSLATSSPMETPPATGYPFPRCVNSSSSNCAIRSSPTSCTMRSTTCGGRLTMPVAATRCATAQASSHFLRSSRRWRPVAIATSSAGVSRANSHGRRPSTS